MATEFAHMIIFTLASIGEYMVVFECTAKLSPGRKHPTSAAEELDSQHFTCSLRSND